MNQVRLKIPVHGSGKFDANEEYEMIIWCWEQLYGKMNEKSRLRQYTYVLFHFEKRLEEVNAFELLTYLRKQLSRADENKIRREINETNKRLFMDTIARNETKQQKKKKHDRLMNEAEMIYFDKLNEVGRIKMLKVLRKQIRNN